MQREGVLVPGRRGASVRPAPVAPPTDVALPVKNNMILQESLAILQEFRQKVDAFPKTEDEAAQ